MTRINTSFTKLFTTLLIISAFTGMAAAADGSLSLTEDYLASGDIPTISVTDSDLNSGSSTAETIIAQVTSSTEGKTSVTGENIDESGDSVSPSVDLTTNYSVAPGTENQITTADFALNTQTNSTGDSIDSVTRNSDGTVTLTVSGLDNDEQETINYTAAETVKLNETGQDTGVFNTSSSSDSISVSTTDSVGTLQISDTDTVAASYYDTDNSDRTGNNQDTATADTSAPTINAAQTGSLTGSSTSKKDIVVDVIESGSGLNTASVDTTDFEVDGTNPTSRTIQNDGDIVLSMSSSFATDATPTVDLVSAFSDTVGNSISTSGAEVSAATDGLSPEVKSATTFDNDKNGEIDGASITFSEAISDSNSDLAASEFEISSTTVGSVSTSSNSNDDTIAISFNNFGDTSTTPNIKSASNGETLLFEDSSSNQLSTSAGNTFTSTTDAAAPVLLSAEIDPSRSTDSLTKIKTSFSETVDTSSSPSLKIEGITVSTTADQDSSTSDSTYVVDNSSLLQTGDSPEVTSVSSITGTGDIKQAVLQGGNNVTIDTFRKQLSDGWNFVSFPIADSTSPSIASVLNESNVNVVWRYDDGQWDSWKPGRSSSENDFSKVEAGQGYLVNASSQHTIAPNVNNVVDSSGTFSQSTPGSETLEEGFNLVGQFQEFNQDADSSSTGTFSSLGSSLGSVYAQSTGLGLNEVTGNTGAVKTGDAYWVSTSGDLSGGTVAYTEN